MFLTKSVVFSLIQDNAGDSLTQRGGAGSSGIYLHELCSLPLQGACSYCSAALHLFPFLHRLKCDHCPLALLLNHFKNWLIIYVLIRLYKLCSDLSSSSFLKLQCRFSPSQTPSCSESREKIRSAPWSNWWLSFDLEVIAFQATLTSSNIFIF